MSAALVLILLSALHLAFGIVRFGARKPGYSHTRDTISELGEVGDPNARLVAYGWFLPVGVALGVVALLVYTPAPAAGALTLCIAIGYVAAALAPCDRGAPAVGSPRQALHNLGGAVEYVGGAAVLFRLSETGGSPYLVAAGAVAVAVVVFSLPALAAVRGLVQRMAEMALFGGLVLALARG